jgi:hypothetical protein
MKTKEDIKNEEEMYCNWYKKGIQEGKQQQAQEFQKKIDEFKMKVEDIISIYMKDGLDIDRSFFDEMYDCLDKIFLEEGEGGE